MHDYFLGCGINVGKYHTKSSTAMESFTVYSVKGIFLLLQEEKPNKPSEVVLLYMPDDSLLMERKYDY